MNQVCAITRCRRGSNGNTNVVASIDARFHCRASMPSSTLEDNPATIRRLALLQIDAVRSPSALIVRNVQPDEVLARGELMPEGRCAATSPSEPLHPKMATGCSRCEAEPHSIQPADKGR